MRPIRLLLPAALLLLMTAAMPAATAIIAGDPLRIQVADNLAMQVFRNEISTTSATYAYERQYYSTYNTYLRLTSTGPNGSATTVATAGNFTPVSNVLNDPGTITTSVTYGDALLIEQRITYTAGAQQFTHRWTVTNQGQTTYTNVALRYGGDTYFYNSDSASGFYDPNTGMVYCTNPGVAGLMGLQPGLDSPASFYYENGYSAVNSALASAPDLPNTVNPAFIDNGMALQWNRGVLAPGGSFTITAIEKWTSAGSVQVLAPAARSATAGTTTPLVFTVQNLLTRAETFTLATTIPTGWTASGLSSVTMPASSATSVTISVTTPTSSAGSSGLVRLTATASSTAATTNSDTVLLTIGGAGPVLPPPTVQAPAAAAPAAGQSVTLVYTVTNPLQVSDILDLTYAAPSGWETTGPASLALPAGGSATVAVVVRVPVTAAGTSSQVRLTATSRASGGSSATPATVNAGQAAYTGVRVTTSAIPLSTTSNLYTGLCPSTPEGLASLRAAVARPDPTRFRAFAWDASIQAYVELPREPAGGLLISSGIFLATRVDLDLDFSGSAGEAAVVITLKPGWTLAGIPPAGTPDGVLTTHAFYADFTVKDTDGSAVLPGSARFVDLLGRVGSNDQATARPWQWNGSSYAQVDTLNSGQAVWFKNNASAAIALSREAPTERQANAVVRSVDSPSPVVDRGAPPTMPSEAKTTQSASGSGCGTGSGFGLLLIGAGLAIGVRLRRRA